MLVKLIGSRMEKDFQEELERSNESINSPSRLGIALKSEGHDISNAYVLHCIHEQAEDLYVVLINSSYLVSVELDRFNQDLKPSFETIELADYMTGLSRMNRVRLLVAQELAGAET